MTTSEDALLRVPGTGLRVPRAELGFRATRAGGPGGQNVNKVASRVEITWDFQASGAPTAEQKARLAVKLAPRLDAEGRLRVVASEARSQLRNREAAEARLVELLAAALRVPKKRKRTRPTAASKERRLESKRRTAHKKRDRRRPRDE
ncbi:MAG TPA: alternative ribosome rescue aminoacyl-tRNA hydrolase ArfB [Gemmatimonadales bacterium]|nr:alternative ribosome rescue aminoacyl-tRNA hydrolase ArfB [Gemmatimonadales bacterium]